MEKKQEAVKSADRLLAYVDKNGDTMGAETRRDMLVAVAVLRQVAQVSKDLRSSNCRKCRIEKCGKCIARWVQGLVGERPPKLNGEERV